ncbi:MAG: methylenetetrahydrofolate reductase [NAD(P)H], partial [Chloroflexi bacterium]|nr:methylenetetrahydrofolate reductase [NAD(P)H] [Chloroflexota bacterium]
CYPEGHNESQSLIDDIRNLKTKVDAGTDQLITQLFFDNSYFYRFRERALIAGINVPVEAGIMPVVNKKQIDRMVSLCGVKLPKKFIAMMEKYENNPVAMRDAGIAYAVDQIVDLVAQGVDGIHLYTMNNSYISHKICAAIRTLMLAA